MCELAKQMAGKYRAPWVIISHIRKDGEMAGKETVQHDVDTVLSFHIEADGTRILECPTKNRNGPTPVFVAFSMTERGLVQRKLTPRPLPESDDEEGAEGEDVEEGERDEDAEAASDSDDDVEREGQSESGRVPVTGA